MKEITRIDHYARIYNKTMDKNIPFIVHWELTYRCNLNCMHCYCAHNNKRKELTYIEIKGIIDELADMGCLYIVFTGGEIFAREDFVKIACYAREKNFALRLLTNGTFITKNAADDIKEILPLSVEMSLYAADPVLHDRITRAAGSFEKTLNAFKLMKERGVKTKLKSIIMNCNKDQLDGLRELARNFSADIVYDFTIVPKDDGSKDPLKFRLNEEEVYRLTVENNRLSNFKPKETVDDNTFMCSAGMNNIAISPYGDVFPCIGLKEPAGNLREGSLEDIINSPVLPIIRATKLSELWTCKNCNLSAYCRRCPGLAVLEGGDYTGPSPEDCKMARVWKRIDLER